jgi:hypothetical protein
MPLAAINNINEVTELSGVYPNPSQGIFNIENFNGGVISIYNMDGEKMFSVNRGASNILNVKGRLLPGTYLISGESSPRQVSKIVILPE